MAGHKPWAVSSYCRRWRKGPNPDSVSAGAGVAVDKGVWWVAWWVQLGVGLGRLLFFRFVHDEVDWRKFQWQRCSVCGRSMAQSSFSMNPLAA